MPKVKLDHPQIIDMYNKGFSAERIANDLACSKAGVFHVLHMYKIPTRTGAKRGDVAERLGYVPTKEDLLHLMYKHRHNASAAASEIELPYSTFIQMLDRFGIERKGGERYADFPVDEAIKLSDEGMTYAQIADKFGVPYVVVSKRLRATGYAPPPRSTNCAPYASASAQRNRFIAGVEKLECVICGETRSVEFCHIKHRWLGGPNDPDNRIILCPTHHYLYDKCPQKLSKSEVRKLLPWVKRVVDLYGPWDGCLFAETAN